MIDTEAHINNGRIELLSKFYGVSAPTIARWRADNTKIPKSAYIILDQHNEINLLNSDKDMLKDEIYHLKYHIKQYFESVKVLKDDIR